MIQNEQYSCRRVVAVTLFLLLFAETVLAGQSRVGLKLLVSEGSAAISVRVTDRDNSPVPRVAVVFTAPDGGVNGEFVNGLNTLTVITDDSGLAVARLSGPDNRTRNIEIRAQYSGETVTTTIRGSGPKKSFNKKLLVIAAAAAAAGAAVAFGNGGGGGGGSTNTSGGSGPSAQPGATPSITFGGSSVGAPRP